MKHLNRSIMEDYEILSSRPERLCAVQFGADARLLGGVDRLLDEANRAGANVGAALVDTDGGEFAGHLKRQDGMFTVFVRGEADEKEVHREQVVQSVLRALDPEADDAALMALARDGGIRFLILSEDEIDEHRSAAAAALAARFLVERFRAGLEPPAVLAFGDAPECARRVKARVAAVAERWSAGEEFARWLEKCRFFPALMDSLTARSGAEEAARLCREMNYADAMIHIAEPYALCAVQADAAFRAEFPLPGVEYVDDIAPLMERKHRLFDAGLAILTALGALHGDATLADCMKDEPLRERLGRALMDEILPCAPLPREEAAQYVIRCCERWENPMNENRLFEAGSGLLRRLRVGVLPAMRAYADDRFELPEHLALTLAAAALVYAGVRRGASGAFELELDGEIVPVHDDPGALEAFSRLSPDMPSDSLAYAVLADRTLWGGEDLRALDGLEESMAANMAMVASMAAQEEEK